MIALITKKWNYYNEWDPFAAAWARELIKAGLVPDGEVDERSITDVRSEDLRGFIQCHFFSGILGWSYALRLAGWPDTRSVWTGSCPCQPFSSAGKGAVTSDTRHLWPAFFKLITECRPGTCFGEQVASADGRAWLDLVFTDLEGSDYRVGAANLCAAGVGAPHIRQRLYWMADTNSDERRSDSSESDTEANGRRYVGRSSEVDNMDDTNESRSSRRKLLSECRGKADSRLSGVAGSMADDAESEHRRRYSEDGRNGIERRSGIIVDESCAINAWANTFWLPCRDGKSRAVESVVEPLADGLSDQLGYVRVDGGEIFAPLIEGAKNRVGRLRGYGNAIVPQVAAEFIKAYLSL